MLIVNAIEEVDNLKPNEYEAGDKIKWLLRLDQQIKAEVLDTHEYNDGEAAPATPTIEDYNFSTELLVPAPYDELYLHYLMAQIDYYNREYDGFQATNAMFTTCYDSFRNQYNATHRPLTTKKTFF